MTFMLYLALLPAPQKGRWYVMSDFGPIILQFEKKSLDRPYMGLNAVLTRVIEERASAV